MAKLAHALAAAAGNAASFELEFFGYNAADSTRSIALPSGLQDGDIGVLYQTGALRTPSAPAGWTQIATTDVTFEFMVSYKILSASDSGTTVTGYDVDTRYANIHVHVFRPSKSISASVVAGSTYNGGGTASSTIFPSASTNLPFIIVALSAAYTTEPLINEGYWTQVAFTTSTSFARLKTYYLVADDTTPRSITQSANYGSYNMTAIASIAEA